MALYISEIFPDSTSHSAADEWLEIYNNGPDWKNLKSWIIRNNKTSFLFEKDHIISANTYQIFSRRQTKINLNNQNEKIEFVNPKGTVIQKITYKKAQTDKSLALIGKTWHWTKPTPQNSNFVEKQAKIPADISVNVLKINEIYPIAGANEEEWIELFNPSENSVDPSHMSISDEKHNFQLPENAIIPSKGYLMLKKSNTKLSLNNERDTIWLRSRSGDTMDQITYDHGQKAKSFSRMSDGTWLWTKATPNQENTQLRQFKGIITDINEQNLILNTSQTENTSLRFVYENSQSTLQTNQIITLLASPIFDNLWQVEHIIQIEPIQLAKIHLPTAKIPIIGTLILLILFIIILNLKFRN